MIGLKKLIAIACMLLVLLGFSVTLCTLVMAAAPDTPQTPAKIDAQRLEGRWQRPDGGYILELKEIKKDGGMKASYFNPKPINVARAEWNRKDGKIVVFVELRDVNYPGSKYNLQYNPKSDRLKGTYFQAVYGEIYGIEFVRVK